jgi:hypothetical protein
VTHEEKFVLAEQSGEDGAFARIDETHPVGLFLGIEAHQRAVMIVCPHRPPDAPALAAIHLEARPRHGGDWALVLRLTMPELKPLFTRLVEDLDAATRQRPAEPGDVVVSRLVRWQRLLSRGASGVLEEHELRGLAAEVDFLLQEALPAVGALAAARAWLGPLDAPKDFVFQTREVEVKATHRQRREVSISSLEQLTDAGVPLYLWCRVAESCVVAPNDPASMAALVARLRDAFSCDAEASQLVEERLRAAGYVDRPEYQQRGVRFGAAACYHVAGAFPRLQRTTTANGVVECRYEIAVSELEPFKAAGWTEALTHGNGA